MDRKHAQQSASDDPLGLRQLPMLDPPADGWPEVARAVSGGLGAARHGRRRRWISGLAMAASVLLAVAVLTRLPGPAERPASGVPGNELATLPERAASNTPGETLDGLVSMSQTLERQVRELRENAGPLPAASAVYLAELQDMVAQVDKELSFSPDSVNLWGQRVNLLLDLAQLYQHQWEREYGRIASL